MATQQVGDMTMQELRAFIVSVVDERIQSPMRPYRQQSDRPIAEVLESIRKNRIVPKPGTPSVVEMLREDRDR